MAGNLGDAAFLALAHPCSTLSQVVSPLTESVLGETLLTVTEEKVSITQLQAQVVASLALSLRPSPGSSHTILATTAAQQTLSFLKQVTGCPACWPGGLQCERMKAIPVCPCAMSPPNSGFNGRSVHYWCPAHLAHPILLPICTGSPAKISLLAPATPRCSH